MYWAMDEYPPDDYVSKHSSFTKILPSIVGFLSGKYCIEWDRFSPEERKHAILNQLALSFNSEEAWNPIGYTEFDWRKEHYSGGCYVGYMPPGVLTKYGSIMRKPVGPIHWGSTELATSWCGYMEGAVESGERAADEILNLVKGSNTFEC